MDAGRCYGVQDYRTMERIKITVVLSIIEEEEENRIK
jgi:hypothetical protein